MTLEQIEQAVAASSSLAPAGPPHRLAQQDAHMSPGRPARGDVCEEGARDGARLGARDAHDRCAAAASSTTSRCAPAAAPRPSACSATRPARLHEPAGLVRQPRRGDARATPRRAVVSSSRRHRRSALPLPRSAHAARARRIYHPPAPSASARAPPRLRGRLQRRRRATPRQVPLLPGSCSTPGSPGDRPAPRGVGTQRARAPGARERPEGERRRDGTPVVACTDPILARDRLEVAADFLGEGANASSLAVEEALEADVLLLHALHAGSRAPSQSAEHHRRQDLAPSATGRPSGGRRRAHVRPAANMKSARRPIVLLKHSHSGPPSRTLI